MRTTILLLAVLTLGLMAGLFYAYAGSVMPGLRRAGDRSSVEVMQRINEAIQNPLFGLIFGGALIFTGIATFQNAGDPGVFWALLVALLLYAATLGVTAVVNIPLNNRLARAGEPDALEDPAAVWAAFFPAWVRWNVLRTLTSVGAFAAGCWALLEY
ncbi:anthrone oxygenase family protein [Actinoplanes sp. NPDC024001]|uniref:anthrone oxygenase family protein n=1 Tax=Actinoplanes sp. NPDC024001 TaxID=3154598 RepID=UPI0033E1A80A